MNATIAEVRDQIAARITEWETTAGLLEAAAPGLEEDLYLRHALRARTAAKVLRENAAALRLIAGPVPLCLFGHGPGERAEAA